MELLYIENIMFTYVTFNNPFKNIFDKEQRFYYIRKWPLPKQ